VVSLEFIVITGGVEYSAFTASLFNISILYTELPSVNTLIFESSNKTPSINVVGFTNPAPLLVTIK